MLENVRKILNCAEPDERLLLAVSGGADSFAMLKWFASQAAWRDRVVVAHVNHKLRKDADFVLALVKRQAESFGLPFVSAVVDVPAALEIRNESVEACARRLRYAALEELRTAQSCSYIITAHSQDDDAETVLMKLKMNSSWYECTGIPVHRGSVLRPFLEITRTDLRSQISPDDEFDCDPMNTDSRYLRVQARTTLSGDTIASAKLSQHGQQLQRLQSLTSRMIKSNYNKILRDSFSSVHSLEKLPKNLYLEDLDFLSVELKWAKLIGQPESRLKSSMRRKVLEFLKAGNCRSFLQLPEGIELHRAGQQFWLSSPNKATNHAVSSLDEVVFTPDSFKQIESGVLSISHEAFYSIDVRVWLPGDKFKPAARRCRKISDWLAEAGVHPAVRAQWPVICQENVIIAVPGLGVAEHAKPRGDNPVVNIHWKAHSLRDQQVSR